MHASNQKPYDTETIFPFSFVAELIEILKSRQSQFVTYRDCPCPRFLPRKLPVINYLLELFHFKSKVVEPGLLGPLRAALKTVEASTRRRLPGFLQVSCQSGPTILLQHDADRQPYKTVDLMRLEQRLGIKSSAFFFYERHIWDDDHEPYDVDVASLQQLESAGFEVGYHLNAYELANYDLEKAWQLVRRDVGWFASHFDLRSFVPHGGVPGPAAINNEHIPYDGPLRDLTWCYNGRSRFGYIKDFSWSDGHVYFADLSDPRLIAENLKPGDRALFLLHPQYYGNRLMENWERLPVARQAWWRKLWEL